MSDVSALRWNDLLAARWAALASRERFMVGSAIVLIFCSAVWWIGLAPAIAKLRQAREAAPQLDAQLQIMRGQAAEAGTLRAQRVLSYEEALRSLESSIKSLGAGANLTVSDSRANVSLRGVSGDALAQWLAQVRANARLVPQELRLKQSAASANPSLGAAPSAASSAQTPPSIPGVAVTWDGSIVLSLPAR
jgi:general secretion pathway protein M